MYFDMEKKKVKQKNERGQRKDMVVARDERNYETQKHFRHQILKKGEVVVSQMMMGVGKQLMGL